MKVSCTSERLKEVMKKKNIKQIDILKMVKPICKKCNVKLGSNDLSQYVTGKVEPSQKKLSVLAEALSVNEVWLMGYDVDYEKTKTITINENDFVSLDNDFLNFRKGTEIEIDYLTLYITSIYITLMLSKNSFIMIDALIQLSNKNMDKKIINRISSIISENLKTIDELNNFQCKDFGEARKKSIYILSSINKIFKNYKNKELKIDELDLKKLEEYVNLELNETKTTGKKIKFNFNKEFISLIEKIDSKYKLDIDTDS